MQITPELYSVQAPDAQAWLISSAGRSAKSPRNVYRLDLSEEGVTIHAYQLDAGGRFLVRECSLRRHLGIRRRWSPGRMRARWPVSAPAAAPGQPA
ncbi:MAG: hypothetical protein ACRDVM_03500 [Acidimicrobiia bacterium]